MSGNERLMYDEIPEADHGGFQEFSPIFTSRSLNLMSSPFQQVMRDLNTLLKTTYNADKVAIIPGSGTFGMEAVARQFATKQDVLVIRNGWFSYRWTEIFDMGEIPSSHSVIKAQPQAAADDSSNQQYAPPTIEQVVEKITKEKPAVVFAPHVETSTGIILPDDYIRQAASAVHDVEGLFVLDCVASGAVWVDMKDLGIDVVITAPQKGWSGPPCAALVMLSEAAAAKMENTKETSYSMSLKKWSSIMQKYEDGGFAYHTTMPTDALRSFHQVSVEMLKVGLPELKQNQQELGAAVRSVMDSRGLTSVAAPGFQAPGVLVFYTPANSSPAEMVGKFKKQGVQIAAGVPWALDEPKVSTFRVGLFGIDKLKDVARTVVTIEKALRIVLAE